MEAYVTVDFSGTTDENFRGRRAFIDFKQRSVRTEGFERLLDDRTIEARTLEIKMYASGFQFPFIDRIAGNFDKPRKLKVPRWVETEMVEINRVVLTDPITREVKVVYPDGMVVNWRKL